MTPTNQNPQTQPEKIVTPPMVPSVIPATPENVATGSIAPVNIEASLSMSTTPEIPKIGETVLPAPTPTPTVEQKPITENVETPVANPPVIAPIPTTETVKPVNPANATVESFSEIQNQVGADIQGE